MPSRLIQSACFSLQVVGLAAWLGLAGPTWAQFGAGPRPAAFWVSPDGNDGGPGTKTEPFRTLQRARDAARTVPRSRQGEITIYLRGGTHRLAETLTLEAADSGRSGYDLVFRPAPGEEPILAGSIPVTGWTQHDSARNIYTTNVGKGVRTRQLYVNGQRAMRARTHPSFPFTYPLGFAPNYDGGDPLLNGIFFLHAEENPAVWRYPELWQKADKIEAVFLNQWKMTRVGVDKIYPPTVLTPDLTLPGLMVMQSPAWQNANSFYDLNQQTGKYQPGLWSFWRVSYFENAYEFLDRPGEWYLDESSGDLFYIPLFNENMATARVELPVLETLIEGRGGVTAPISNIRFQGLTFAYATWLDPSSPDGYVADQSGFHLVGADNPPNLIGHNLYDVRTPGNLKFKYAHNIKFHGNRFQHLGAVALDFDTGSQRNQIINNFFSDISSAAVQLGGIAPWDHHPSRPQEVTRDNRVEDNLIYRIGRDYVDAAGVTAAFTERTTIRHNTIIDTPWSAVSIGWGWGLLDPGSFPGVTGAVPGQWGFYDTPTATRGNRVLNNRFEDFINVVWDGGAVYSLSRQGRSLSDGLLIQGNVATQKRPSGGGNVFYTDGGSRFVRIRNNAMFDNPVGNADFGPCPLIGFDPLPYSPIPCLGNSMKYGGDIGGCRAFGDIRYSGNYWTNPDFFTICPYRDENGVSYPTRLAYRDNHLIETRNDVPRRVLRAAGRRSHNPLAR